MKKVTQIILLSIFAFFVSACGQKSGPGATMVQMWEKICQSKSLTPMSEYTAPESQKLVDMVVAMSTDPKKGTEIMTNINSQCSQKITVVSEQITGETAEVVLSTDNKATKLRLVEGKWKMVIDKK